MSRGRGLYACLIWLFACSAAIAQTNGQLNVEQTEQAWKGHKQVEQCAWCHYQPGNTFASRPTDFCQLTEARHWLSADPHALSRLRIEPWPADDRRASSANKVSRSIAERLGYRVDTAEGYQKFSENCLSCHAGYQPTSQPYQHAGQGPPGISCTYCHQTDDQAKWVDLHGATSAPDTWRLLPPAAKQAHGMRHLAAADAQAKLCYQCHIGDLSRNMFVSHRMYVAGHPPLPSVELHSLTEATSPHWRGPRELYASMSQTPTARDEYFATHLSVPATTTTSSAVAPTNRQWRAQATALGAVQAQSQWLSMMEQSSAEQYRQHWADYALYDCAGCHHGLQSPSWRQQHRLATPPGRPLPVQWTAVVERALPLAVASALEQPRAEYLQAVTAMPFGDRSRVSIAARSYRQALESLQTTLSTAALEPQFSRTMLDQLAATRPVFLSDYESARQLRWSAVSISRDLLHVGAISPSNAQAVEQLHLPARPDRYDPANFYQQVDQWRRSVSQ